MKIPALTNQSGELVTLASVIGINVNETDYEAASTLILPSQFYEGFGNLIVETFHREFPS